MYYIIRFLLIFVYVFSSTLFCQEKTLFAEKLNNQLKIDGKLEDWQLKAYNLIQTAPDNGVNSREKIEVSIMYDQEFLYVGAKLYINADSINTNLTFRDDLSNNDYFGITLDPYGKGSEGYSFIVTPGGTQYDSKYGADGSEFSEWNAVWESKVLIQKNFWTVEMKIPFNFLRFDKDNLSDFRFNMVRFISLYNEQSWWNHIDPKKNGFLNQFGYLKGINNINTPINISFYPFTTALYKNDVGNHSQDFDFNAGLDVRYVHNNTFTVDASIIPDFSQTTFDNEILNLSAFEVKFDENRQFFTEGTDLFNRSDFFYSRRMGGTPYLSPQNINDETVSEYPNSTQILNLLKVTGRTDNGLGIGVLNGIVGREYVKYDSGNKELINPLSNYNSIVFDKALKNNSFLYLANSSVLRENSSTDFNLTEFKFRGFDRDQDYSLSLSASLSQHYQKNATDLGYYYKVELGKVSGNFQGGVSHKFYDKNFDPNDFGFLSRNNLASFSGFFSYIRFNPFWKLNGLNLSLTFKQDYYQSLWERERTRFQLNSRATLKNNDLLSIGAYLRLKGKDFFEPRIPDRFSMVAANFQPYVEYITDTNDPFYVQGYFFYKYYFDSPFNYEVKTGYFLNQNVNNRLKLSLGQDYEYLASNMGVLFVDGSQIYENDLIHFSERDVYNLTTSLKGSYLLNKKMGFTVSLRHFWAQVKNISPYYINTSGQFYKSNVEIDYTDRQINYNLFNLDFLYKWQFAPGSELSFNWQNAIAVNDKNLENNFFRNVSNTFKKENGIHTFSFKLVYFIDFNKLKKNVQ